MGRGQVGLRDQVFPVQRDVADGREIEEFEVTRALGFERGLQAAQFLVLHFQFDLVHEEFVHSVGRIGSRASRFAHPCQGCFGAAAQVGVMVVRRLGHAVWLLTCSVVATA